VRAAVLVCSIYMTLYRAAVLVYSVHMTLYQAQVLVCSIYMTLYRAVREVPSSKKKKKKSHLRVQWCVSIFHICAVVCIYVLYIYLSGHRCTLDHEKKRRKPLPRPPPPPSLGYLQSVFHKKINFREQHYCASHQFLRKLQNVHIYIYFFFLNPKYIYIYI